MYTTKMRCAAPSRLDTHVVTNAASAPEPIITPTSALWGRILAYSLLLAIWGIWGATTFLVACALAPVLYFGYDRWERWYDSRP